MQTILRAEDEFSKKDRFGIHFVIRSKKDTFPYVFRKRHKSLFAYATSYNYFNSLLKFFFLTDIIIVRIKHQKTTLANI